MKSATLQLETLTCPSCMQKIEGAIKALDGVRYDKGDVQFQQSKTKFDEDKISLKTLKRPLPMWATKFKNPVLDSSTRKGCVPDGERTLLARLSHHGDLY